MASARSRASTGSRVAGLRDLNQLESNLSKLKTRQKNLYTGIRIRFDENYKDLKYLQKRFPKSIKKAHKGALVLLKQDLQKALNDAIEAKVWNWEYGDGDIIDTGELRDSLDLNIEGDRISIAYRVDHAGIVHYGAYIYLYGNPGIQVYMPPRPWIDAVLNGGGPVPKFDFETTYVKYFSQILETELSAIGAI